MSSLLAMQATSTAQNCAIVSTVKIFKKSDEIKPTILCDIDTDSENEDDKA